MTKNKSYSLKEKYVPALVALWFALIFSSISTIYLYLFFKGSSTNVASSFFSIIITLVLIGLGILSWIVTITLLFGKKVSISE